ncbi:MAG TPA: CocE/NonD family hydrolase [Candidatus Binataceae bacterium]|nr:CocE/NonD family hydrolase [Candidatus Binataceae bacterium]
MIVQARKTYRVVTEKDVPMKTRDGVTLYADVIRPDVPGRFPVLLSRTPYNKKGSDDPNGASYLYARYGYITIMQDCRGRFSSEGEYDTIFQEAADGYDAVEWAARLPWSNGRVGTTGQSYLGLTQYLIACNDPMPPSLQVMAPVSASSDYHASWIYHTGGASMWGWIVPYAIFKGLNTLKRADREDLQEKMKQYVIGGEFPIMRKTKWGFNAFTPLTDEWYRHLPIKDWADLLKETAPYMADHIKHANDSEYWYRANVNRHAASVTVPMLHVSSWYDIFGEGAPTAYQSIKNNSRFEKARKGQRLIIGPWGHLLPYNFPNSRGTGDIDFGPSALIDLNETLLRWFDYWLKDIDNGIMEEPPVTVYTLGANRWQHLPDWPPPNMRHVPYFIHAENGANSLRGDGVLSTVPPAGETTDHFVYDPNDPVPSLGGNNLAIDMGIQDQRPAEERNDVLVYTSEPLEQPLEITGPVSVVLWASSSAIDTDFTAKLVDVRPDGYAQNLTDGIIRARYRESSSAPQMMEPGKPYQFTIDLWATSNVFMPGHRIRLEISSSNFPHFDRNLNTGEAFGEGTKGIQARQTVFHQEGMASHILLPVIPR